MKQVEVTILGQSYRLMCPVDGEDSLRQAVSTVDQEMSSIRDAGKVKARERIAVLAALNLAYRLADRGPLATTGATTVPAVQPAPNGEAHVSNDTVERLVQRIDGVLGNDGHLL